jgi:hypothetical protein
MSVGGFGPTGSTGSPPATGTETSDREQTHHSGLADVGEEAV